ncbi:uncharacterized protein KD926_003205 [Aspergillus affinis]|uniref:uncharacterized protein n=1 Tax=Aspergillus affinis TaxID=1070780 RepID=UPI0022FEE5CC|nr:uncharacterized protein KD926_003205 [Aspergillus affinis]KAI9035601.1 hypothetical protein KD926_003205 [Aspergillus affinis]
MTIKDIGVHLDICKWIFFKDLSAHVQDEGVDTASVRRKSPKSGIQSIDSQKLLYFVFPRDPFFEKEFHTVGKELFFLLEYCIDYYMHDPLPHDIKIAAIESLVSTSKLKWASLQKTLIKAGNLLDETLPEYLHILVAHQWSVQFRLQSDFIGSEQVIHQYCMRSKQPVTGREYALRMQLHVSHLEKLIQTERYNQANKEVGEWKIQEFNSAMSSQVAPSQTLVIYKLDRCQGNFDEVYTALESCYNRIKEKMALAITRFFAD